MNGYQAISDKLHIAYGIAGRIQALRYARLQRTFKDAGLGDVNMCSLYNSLISYDQGRPWREVNYSAARKARWLHETSFEANRIIDRFYERMCAELRSIE